MNHCTKCGSDNVKPAFVPVGEPIRPSEVVSTQQPYMKKDFTVDLHGIVEKEHLLMTCKFCGYTWATDTKDNR